jgi:Rieske Fe-S protein
LNRRRCGANVTIGVNGDTISESGARQRRRSFLTWFLGGSVTALLASIAYPIARFLGTPKEPEAATNQVQVGPTNDPELVEKGFKIVPFGNEPVIVIKLSETDIRAFSAVCTHLACIVEFQKAKQDIFCNCHGGVYDLHGRNIAGPPPRPLTPYQVHIVERGAGQPGVVVISKV